MATGTREHGGDPQRALAEAGLVSAPQDLLDLSTGVNPVPYRFRPLPGSVWADLPVQTDLDHLLETARAYYGVPADASIVASPGSQALIQLLPRLINARRVRVVGPTYNEHEHVWRRTASDVRIVENIADAADADVIVVVNPNNPDGRIASQEGLLEIAERQTGNGGWLIVDEAFADTQPEITAAGLCARHNVIALKSFGKFFGLAGLRLGFLIGQNSLVGNADVELGPWAVTGPALKIGAEALANEAWHQETRRRLNSDAAELDALLAQHKLPVIGGTSLFRLVQTGKAQDFYRQLLQNGISVRRFSAHPTWLRFGVPDDQGRGRLAEALAS